MPPTTTSTAVRSTSLAATVSATLSSVALSSMNNSTGRPSRPPRALMSSITILATFALAMPMNESGPVWSVMTPTRAERLIAVVIVVSSRAVGTEQRGGLRLAEVAGFLEDRRHFGVGDELRPPVFVPVEERPHAVRLVRVLEHRRALRAVQPALLGALRTEHVEEPLDVFDGGRCQDHDCPLCVGSFDPLVRR